MKFWTALQEPLSQAAFVIDGQITRCIPERSPRTPARKVYCVGEFDGNLVVGRRNHLELWKADGSELLASLYHPLIFDLHEVQQYRDLFLVACAAIDCIFLMDQDGQTKWTWWAHQEGYCPRVPEVDRSDWKTIQITSKKRNFVARECHLNSARIFGEEALVSLMLKGVILSVPLGGQRSTQLEAAGTDATIHSPIRTASGSLAYGCQGGMRLPDRLVEGFEWVKRVYEVDPGTFLFTHESGVTQVDSSGTVQEIAVLPRPFGVALLDRG